MYTNDYSRRKFLKQAMLASAAVAAPGLLKAREPQKVNLACIGIGNRGEKLFPSCIKQAWQILWHSAMWTWVPAYPCHFKQFPDVPRFQDFRQMFDKMGKQIEAVSMPFPIFRIFPLP